MEALLVEGAKGGCWFAGYSSCSCDSCCGSSGLMTM